MTTRGRPAPARSWIARVGLALALAFVASAARADTPPSRWDRAKDPAAARRWTLHASVRERLLPDRSRGAEAGLRARLARIEEARDELEAAGAEASPDVRLRFDLGEIYAQLDMHARAAEVLSAALAVAPDHPAAIDAWFQLAMAEARLGHHEKERDAHLGYLARASHDPVRILVTLSNLAEAEMHLGDLDEAVARWEQCLSLAGSLPNLFDSQTVVLAEYGLALAQDRRRDPVASARHARSAVALDPAGRIISNTDYVFFVPEYERSWYLALAHMTLGREAKDPRVAAMYYGQAERHWTSYVEAGKRHNDRWLRLAAQHRDEAREERLAAQKRAPPAGLPRSPHEVPTWGLPY